MDRVPMILLILFIVIQIADAYWFTGPLCIIGLGVLANNVLVLKRSV